MAENANTIVACTLMFHPPPYIYPSLRPKSNHVFNNKPSMPNPPCFPFAHTQSQFTCFTLHPLHAIHHKPFSILAGIANSMLTQPFSHYGELVLNQVDPLLTFLSAARILFMQNGFSIRAMLSRVELLSL